MAVAYTLLYLHNISHLQNVISMIFTTSNMNNKQQEK